MISARWRLVGLLWATATASYLCRVNVSIAAPLLMSEFGLSGVEMGRIFSAFLLGYAACQIPGGMLSDRFGARRLLRGAAWWWVGATGLTTLIGTASVPLSGGAALGALLLVRFLLGVGEAPTFPAAAKAVARTVPPASRGRANGLVVSAIGLGSALTPPLVSSVMIGWGWRTALLVSGVPALVVAVAWPFVREPEPVMVDDAASAPDQECPTSPDRSRRWSLMLLTLSYTLQGYVGYIFVFWFYLYLVEERHFDLLRGAVLSSLPWILSIISIPLGGYLSDRLAAGGAGLVGGRRAVPIVGLAGSGVFISLGARTGSPFLAAGYLALATALVLAVEGPFWAAMTEMAGSRTGAAGGVMNMGGNLGGLVSPALTPVLAARLGWEVALQLAAGISVVAALLWLGVTPGRTGPSPASTVPGGTARAPRSGC